MDLDGFKDTRSPQSASSSNRGLPSVSPRLTAAPQDIQPFTIPSSSQLIPSTDPYTTSGNGQDSVTNDFWMDQSLDAILGASLPNFDLSIYDSFGPFDNTAPTNVGVQPFDESAFASLLTPNDTSARSTEVISNNADLTNLFPDWMNAFTNTGNTPSPVTHPAPLAGVKHDVSQDASIPDEVFLEHFCQCSVVASPHSPLAASC